MGIKGLSKLIQQQTDGTCIKQNEIKSYFGREIAIDASMALYQFLIAVRMQSDSNGGFQQLMNDSGEVTSHLIGILYRTIRMREHGIKPVYVFDGKPPDFKSHELEKRKANREKAQQELKEAEKADDKEKVAQMQKRLVRVDKTHVAEAQRLLDCLGVPWIAAPGEAEAQCAILVKEGLVYGSATEDMDALTFGTPRLIRNLTYSEARKLPVLEFDLEKVLKGLDVTMDQFIDICILLGCDYIPSIKGIGPAKAVTFIKEHGNIEGLLKALETGKITGNYIVPEGFLFEEARKLFKKPDVTENKEELGKDLKWKDCNEEALIEFLVNEKHFSLERIQSAIKRLKKCKGKSSQRRVDAFFSFTKTTTSSSKINKMKMNEKSNKKGKKNSKLSKSTKKTKNNEKAGPYANSGYSDKTKTKSTNSNNNDNNSSNSNSNNNSTNADNSSKSVKKSVKSTKKAKKSTKKRKATTKKTKSTKKSKKSAKKKITGVKRKRIDMDEEENGNKNGNNNDNNSNELPDIGNVSLDSKTESKGDSNNNDNNNEDDSESIELAGFDDTIDDNDFDISEPPRKRQRLMTNSINNNDKNINEEEKEKEITSNDIEMDKTDKNESNQGLQNNDKVESNDKEIEENDVKSVENVDNGDSGDVKNGEEVDKTEDQEEEDIDIEIEMKDVEMDQNSNKKSSVVDDKASTNDKKMVGLNQMDDEVNKENDENVENGNIQVENVA